MEFINLLKLHKDDFSEEFKYLSQYNDSMINLEDADQLTSIGDHSIFQIAKRILDQDFVFFNSSFKFQNYYFRTTQVTRVMQSGSIFA